MKTRTRVGDMTNVYRILIGKHDGNRKIRGLKGKWGGYMRRERECVGAAVVTCLMIGSKWLVVVNTAVKLLFTREARNVTGMLSNCQRLKNSAACI